MKTKSSKLFFISTLTLLFLAVDCRQHEVGWKTPKSKQDLEKLNKWASNHRFIVGDTVHFKYEKDSVMEVSEKEYEKCQTSQPIFFSNNINETVFVLDRAGPFYFISGISGHCQKGQKLIIKVLDHRRHVARAHSPEPASAHTGSSSNKAVFGLKTLVIFVISYLLK